MQSLKFVIQSRNWWLIELPVWLTDGFFGHYFWNMEGTVSIHVNSRVAHVWLPYTAINVQAGGGKQTLENSENLEIWKFA